MAVQKNKKSRSKRNMRRNSKTTIKLPCLILNKKTNEIHLRHFMTRTGYYKNKKIIEVSKKKVKS